MGTNYQRLHEKEYQDILKKLDAVLDNNKTVKSDNKKLTIEIHQLKKENKKLTKEVSRLKNQINKDSSNSGKPPSSNGFTKVVQNNREKAWWTERS